MCQINELRRLIEVLAGKEWMGNYPNGIRAICNFSTSIESQRIGDPLFFQLILYKGRFREGKEPTDRVYGFLGLAKSTPPDSNPSRLFDWG